MTTANGTSYTQLVAVPVSPPTNSSYAIPMGSTGPLTLWGTVDPTATGVTAPIGSTYSNTTTGTFYSKTGSGHTQWTAR